MQTQGCRPFGSLPRACVAKLAGGWSPVRLPRVNISAKTIAAVIEARNATAELDSTSGTCWWTYLLRSAAASQSRTSSNGGGPPDRAETGDGDPSCQGARAGSGKVDYFGQPGTAALGPAPAGDLEIEPAWREGSEVPSPRTARRESRSCPGRCPLVPASLPPGRVPPPEGRRRGWMLPAVEARRQRELRQHV